MNTILTESPREAAEFIKLGGVVAFPTETVYGLGANVFDETAIRKIFTAKMRPADNPLIAHIAEVSQIKTLVSNISKFAEKLIEVFFPAPLTLVLPKAENVPLVATANLNSIGVRMPQSIIAQEFLRFCEVPIVAPSANLSGKPSPTNWQAVYEDLNGRIDCILQGDETEIGLESTVVDCTGEKPLILRLGAVTFEQLREVVSNIEIYTLKLNEMPKSPGLKHRHYAPNAKIILIPKSESKSPQSKVKDQKSNIENPKSKIQNPKSKAAFIGLSAPPNTEEFALVKICATIENYAHELFRFFRECDESGIAQIFCQIVEAKGLGSALMDRLRRASETF